MERLLGEVTHPNSLVAWVGFISYPHMCTWFYRSFKGMCYDFLNVDQFWVDMCHLCSIFLCIDSGSCLSLSLSFSLSLSLSKQNTHKTNKHQNITNKQKNLKGNECFVTDVEQKKLFWCKYVCDGLCLQLLKLRHM